MYKSVLTVAAFLVLCACNAKADDATDLVADAARRHDVPVEFALRVAEVESGISCGDTNRVSGATGPLQILPSSARALGFRGNIIRASCATKTEYGMKHLAMCYHGADGNRRRAAACHYQGASALNRMTVAGARYAAKVLN